MIAYLEGKILTIGSQSATLLCNGVGYAVLSPQQTLQKLVLNDNSAFHIYTHVREDDISLFGFLETDQLHLFKQLLKVNGIGAKTALALLELPVVDTQNAIIHEDIAYLTQAPGLGKKTAARLCLDLKDKLSLSPANNIAGPLKGSVRNVEQEAIDALTSLGYSKHNIIRFLNTTDTSQCETAEDLVRTYLQTAL